MEVKGYNPKSTFEETPFKLSLFQKPCKVWEIITAQKLNKTTPFSRNFKNSMFFKETKNNNQESSMKLIKEKVEKMEEMSQTQESFLDKNISMRNITFLKSETVFGEETQIGDEKNSEITILGKLQGFQNLIEQKDLINTQQISSQDQVVSNFTPFENLNNNSHSSNTLSSSPFTPNNNKRKEIDSTPISKTPKTPTPKKKTTKNIKKQKTTKNNKKSKTNNKKQDNDFLEVAETVSCIIPQPFKDNPIFQEMNRKHFFGCSSSYNENDYSIVNYNPSNIGESYLKFVRESFEGSNYVNAEAMNLVNTKNDFLNILKCCIFELI